MKVLIIDWDGMFLAFAIRCKLAGHDVKLWIPVTGGVRCDTGDGLVDRPKEWQPLMKWADLIIVTGNSRLRRELKPFFNMDLPIFGTNDAAAELELDRCVGQKAFEDAGVETAPYEVFSNFDKAISFVKKTDQAYACKPWGGTGDKSLTYVSKTPEDMIFTLERWKALGVVKGSFMLQEKIDGIEMEAAGFFGPGGWSSWIEEAWEHKKLLAGDLGCNTGEMGTVIRYTQESKLFSKVVEPLTECLAKLGYIGDCAVNCIIDHRGRPWPLEFTLRLGWPDWNIRQVLHEGDPVEWMLDLVHGRDTLKTTGQCAVGVLLYHGDFPHCAVPKEQSVGFPLYGYNKTNKKRIELQDFKASSAGLVTTGTYIAVVNGKGKTVHEAQKDAYSTVEELDIPSNLGYRPDIGDKLKTELSVLHSQGYAHGLQY